MPGSNTPKRRNRREPSQLVVEVANRQRRRIAGDSVIRAVRHVLSARGWTRGEISVAIVDARAMRRINRRYLNHDYSTDVLSFRLSRDPRKNSLQGEIVICADVAASVASQQPWKWQEELLFYAVHGALHLIGYNDQSVAQRRRMRAAERRMLRELAIPVTPGALAAQSKERT